MEKDPNYCYEDSACHSHFSFGCRCGAEGIKVECTPNNDTICNDKVEGMA